MITPESYTPTPAHVVDLMPRVLRAQVARHGDEFEAMKAEVIAKNEELIESYGREKRLEAKLRMAKAREIAYWIVFPSLIAIVAWAVSQ